MSDVLGVRVFVVPRRLATVGGSARLRHSADIRVWFGDAQASAFLYALGFSGWAPIILTLPLIIDIISL